MMQLRDPQQTKVISSHWLKQPHPRTQALADFTTRWHYAVGMGSTMGLHIVSWTQHCCNTVQHKKTKIDALYKQHPPRLSYVAMQKETR